MAINFDYEHMELSKHPLIDVTGFLPTAEPYRLCLVYDGRVGIVCFMTHNEIKALKSKYFHYQRALSGAMVNNRIKAWYYDEPDGHSNTVLCIEMVPAKERQGKNDFSIIYLEDIKDINVENCLKDFIFYTQDNDVKNAINMFKDFKAFGRRLKGLE